MAPNIKLRLPSNGIVTKKQRCGNTPPPKEESSKREGSTELNIEALVREAFENLKAQVEAEEKLKIEANDDRGRRDLPTNAG